MKIDKHYFVAAIYNGEDETDYATGSSVESARLHCKRHIEKYFTEREKKKIISASIYLVIPGKEDEEDERIYIEEV